ncbi:MAG TPA: PIN domain-containing protein [Tichowtungia sp.]|nr:PIN domain-containing protein [Tichowtungia sp.]
MSIPVLLDTGPLVAACNARDHFHQWACEQFRLLIPPLLTCEAVLAEACFLLGSEQTAILDMISTGLIKVDFEVKKEHRILQKLLRKYSDVPMSLADACLVRMSEIHENSAVFTLDQDFTIYRKNGRQVIPRIIPD